MLRSFIAVNRATNQERTFHVNDAVSDSVKVSIVDGLDPVESTVMKNQYALRAGASYQGTLTPDRNIVLTFKLEPNYATESVQALRNELYLLFQENLPVRLRFTWDDVTDPVVYIDGWVDKINAPMFTQEPMIQISIICPDPYFISESTPHSIVFPGTTENYEFTGDIRGTAPAPYELRIPTTTGKTLNYIWATFRSGTPAESSLYVSGFERVALAGEYVSLYNYPGARALGVRNSFGFTMLNLLNKTIGRGDWPALIPKKQSIVAMVSHTDISSARVWTLIYTPRFKGL